MHSWESPFDPSPAGRRRGLVPRRRTDIVFDVSGFHYTVSTPPDVCSLSGPAGVYGHRTSGRRPFLAPGGGAVLRTQTGPVRSPAQGRIRALAKPRAWMAANSGGGRGQLDRSR